MSMEYGLFAAKATEVDGVTVYDRSVGDEFFHRLFSAITENGIVGDSFEVTASGDGMVINVSAGAAIIEGRFCFDTSEAQLVLETTDAAREDLVVLRLSIPDRSITLEASQGASEPVRTSDTYELALARVSLTAGATTVTSSMITDLRSSDMCGSAGAATAPDYSKQDKPGQISFSNGASLTLVDNTEYRSSTTISSLTVAYPSGNFEAWMRFTTAASTPTITFPSSSEYIGDTPSFGASETWEISVKDGYVIARKVGG